jgi:hypothetical protein
MATNFKITQNKSQKSTPSNYEVVREYRKEREHVMALEKELKAHEKTDMSHAHPMHSPSAGTNQPTAGIPALRKG